MFSPKRMAHQPGRIEPRGIREIGVLSHGIASAQLPYAYPAKKRSRNRGERILIGKLQEAVAVIADAHVSAVLGGANRIKSREHPSNSLDERLVRRCYDEDAIIRKMLEQVCEEATIIEDVLDDLRGEDKIKFSNPPRRVQIGVDELVRYDRATMALAQSTGVQIDSSIVTYF